jgi:hypothetical protein
MRLYAGKQSKARARVTRSDGARVDGWEWQGEGVDVVMFVGR